MVLNYTKSEFGRVTVTTKLGQLCQIMTFSPPFYHILFNCIIQYFVQNRLHWVFIILRTNLTISYFSLYKTGIFLRQKKIGMFEKKDLIIKYILEFNKFNYVKEFIIFFHKIIQKLDLSDFTGGSMRLKLGNRVAANTLSSSSLTKKEDLLKIVKDITGTKCTFSVDGKQTQFILYLNAFIMYVFDFETHEFFCLEKYFNNFDNGNRTHNF